MAQQLRALVLAEDQFLFIRFIHIFSQLSITPVPGKMVSGAGGGAISIHASKTHVYKNLQYIHYQAWCNTSLIPVLKQREVGLNEFKSDRVYTVNSRPPRAMW